MSKIVKPAGIVLPEFPADRVRIVIDYSPSTLQAALSSDPPGQSIDVFPLCSVLTSLLQNLIGQAMQQTRMLVGVRPTDRTDHDEPETTDASKKSEDADSNEND